MTKLRTTTETSQGPVAQMAEHVSCKDQVAGSIPGQDLHPLTFKEVFSCLKQANKKIGKIGDVDLEVWIENKMYRIVRVGQFGVVPTVTLTLAEKPEYEF